jgi:hypothetical protein
MLRGSPVATFLGESSVECAQAGQSGIGDWVRRLHDFKS